MFFRLVDSLKQRVEWVWRAEHLALARRQERERDRAASSSVEQRHDVVRPARVRAAASAIHQGSPQRRPHLFMAVSRSFVAHHLGRCAPQFATRVTRQRAAPAAEIHSGLSRLMCTRSMGRTGRCSARSANSIRGHFSRVRETHRAFIDTETLRFTVDPLWSAPCLSSLSRDTSGIDFQLRFKPFLFRHHEFKCHIRRRRPIKTVTRLNT